MIILLALVFRGLAFEFRFSQPWLTAIWRRGFSVGSAIATFAQGAVLGAFLHGFTVNGRNFAGTSWEWADAIFGIHRFALMFGSSLLGAGWLVIKMEGSLKAWSRRMGKRCFYGVIASILVVSLWSPLMDTAVAARWFSSPNYLYLAPVPIVTAVIASIAWLALQRWWGDATLSFATPWAFPDVLSRCRDQHLAR